MYWQTASIARVSTPMLVEHAPALPEGDEWDYEYSWPGERVLGSKDGPCVRIASVLHRRDFTNRFPVVAAAIAKLPATTLVIDGIVGPIDPAALNHYGLEPGAAAMRIALVAADLLWLDGFDVRQLPLRERKHRLQQLIAGTAILGTGATDVPVAQMITEARRLGAEAVIAKRRSSRYRPFGHSGDWIRVAVEPVMATRAETAPGAGGTAAGIGLRTSSAFGVGQMA